MNKKELKELLNKLYGAVVDSYVPNDVELDNDEYNAAVDYQNYLLSEWNGKCNQLSEDDMIDWLLSRCYEKLSGDNIDISIIYNNV